MHARVRPLSFLNILLFFRNDHANRNDQHLQPCAEYGLQLIRQLTFTAEKAELQDRLKAFAEAGYSQFTIQLVEHQYDALEQWAEVFIL